MGDTNASLMPWKWRTGAGSSTRERSAEIPFLYRSEHGRKETNSVMCTSMDLVLSSQSCISHDCTSLCVVLVPLAHASMYGAVVRGGQLDGTQMEPLGFRAEFCRRTSLAYVTLTGAHGSSDVARAHLTGATACECLKFCVEFQACGVVLSRRCRPGGTHASCASSLFRPQGPLLDDLVLSLRYRAPVTSRSGGITEARNIRNRRQPFWCRSLCGSSDR